MMHKGKIIRCSNTGEQRCGKRKELDISECFHLHEFMTDAVLDQKLQEIEKYLKDALTHQYNKLEEVRKKSTLKISPSQANRLEDPRHIDFKPRNEDQRRKFLERLQKELNLRLQSQEKKKELAKQHLEKQRAFLKQLAL